MGTGPLVSFDTRWPGRSLVEHAALSPSSIGDTTLPAAGVALGAVEVAARVNAGRWIADCPAPGCGGAEYVNLDAPVFFCCQCRNSLYGNQPLPAKIPDAKTRGQIDAYLTARPLRTQQHWLPSETVKDLQEENRAYGVRLP